MGHKIISANQLYRESGWTLPFKAWIDYQKKMGILLPPAYQNNNMSGNNENNPIMNIRQPNTLTLGHVPKIDKKNNWVAVAILAITVGGLIYLYYHHEK